jgi:hypothetical protein
LGETGITMVNSCTMSRIINRLSRCERKIIHSAHPLRHFVMPLNWRSLERHPRPPFFSTFLPSCNHTAFHSRHGRDSRGQGPGKSGEPCPLSGHLPRRPRTPTLHKRPASPLDCEQIPLLETSAIASCRLPAVRPNVDSLPSSIGICVIAQLPMPNNSGLSATSSAVWFP